MAPAPKRKKVTPTRKSSSGSGGPIRETYLVSDKITRVPAGDLAALKRFMGGTLPTGYADYIRRFGTSGRYVGELCVWSPAVILKATEKERQVFGDLYCEQREYDNPRSPLTDDDLRNFFPFGGNSEGDSIVAFTRFPGELFIIQRHAPEFVRVKAGFTDPLRLVEGGRKLKLFRYFLPEGPHLKHEVIHIETEFTPAQIADVICDLWKGNELHHAVDHQPPSNPVHLVFVRELGAQFTIVRENTEGMYVIPPPEASMPWVRMAFDKQYARPIRTFIARLRKACADESDS